jgi:hypothetical protein
MSSLFQLVYVSTAKADISYTDIRNILDSSRKNNALDDVTGLLIFRDGFFLQLLEGQETAVKNILGKILLDTRNEKVRVLVQEDAPSRLFHDWNMAFVDGDLSTNETQDLLDLFEIALQADISKRTLIPVMLRRFRGSGVVLS